MTDFLRELRAANIDRNSQWDPDAKLPTMFRALELAGEVGELCNMVKKQAREQLIGGRGKRVPTFREIQDEVADVMICLDLLCMNLGIDLATATALKFNESSEVLGLDRRLPLARTIDDEVK